MGRRAFGGARFHCHADGCLGHASGRGPPHRGAGDVDDFRIETGADGFEDGLAGSFGREVDGAGAIEVERDAGLVRRDESEDNVADIAACEVVRLQRVARDIDPGFDRGDAIIDDHANRHLAEPHGDHLSEADRRIGDPGAKPEAEEIKDHDRDDEGDDAQHGDAEEVEGFHARKLREQPKRGKR